jgi:hypothetical protein
MSLEVGHELAHEEMLFIVIHQVRARPEAGRSFPPHWRSLSSRRV